MQGYITVLMQENQRYVGFFLSLKDYLPHLPHLDYAQKNVNMGLKNHLPGVTEE